MKERVAKPQPNTRPKPAYETAIEIVGLVVSYGNKQVLNGLSLSVPAGSIFGFLGANGAGKTTTIKTLLGFRPPNGGAARVMGYDVVRQSVLFTDVLRPAMLALGVMVVLALPIFLPSWQNWSLVYYWSSADAYFKGVFPLANLLVDLTAAALPLFAALVLFRRRAY